ncbi:MULTISPECIES: hypothetical protein [unclassified Massilia]|uniref:hypothetical protein n=1 Tax=unclassified Massilia TaxID=2609279 RepID=UPI000A8792DA|nr:MULTISPECIES: hypothetical protein [unclassified Massilia]
MIFSCIALAMAFAMDVFGLFLLVAMRATVAAPLGVIALHAGACLLATCALPSLFPAAYRSMPRCGWFFLWLVAFSTPVLGMLGLVLALVPALRRQRTPVCRAEWLHSNVSERFDTGASPGRAGAINGDRCLMGVLRCAPGRHSRLRALIATLSLDAQGAAPLLRIGLLDRDDDVRLLAYSLLTRKEKAIEERIGKSLRQVDSEAKETVLAAHRALAYDYWELALLGGGGGATAFLLEQAREHAQAGIAMEPRQACLQLLLGRILLKTRQLEAARAALLHAAVGGVAIDKVAPFLAEIAFHRGQFRQIGTLLNMGKSSDQVWRLRSASAYWKERYRAC